MINEINNFKKGKGRGKRQLIAIVRSVKYIRNSMEINFASSINIEGEFTEDMNSYLTWLVLENLRRGSVIEIPDKNLPKLDNIFDQKRELAVVGLLREVF